MRALHPDSLFSGPSASGEGAAAGARVEVQRLLQVQPFEIAPCVLRVARFGPGSAILAV